MAPLDDVLNTNDLLGFSQSVQATNPYGLAGQSLGSWQPDMRTWSGTESGVASFAKSFLSGLLNNYAQQQTAEQVQKVASVLPQLTADPMSVVAPEGVDAGPFALLRGSAFVKNAAREAATVQALAQQGISIDPKSAVPIADQVNKVFGDREKQKILGQIEGQKAGYGMTSGAELPDSPQAKASKLAREEEDAARKEISSFPAVQKLNTTSTALAQINKMKDLDTKSSDIPFATIFIGGLDGSVVKEGEYARVAGSNPFLTKYRNLFESVLNGKSELGVDIKRQMYQELAASQKDLLDEAMRQAKPRLDTALARGASQSRVLPFDPQMQFGAMQDRTSTGITAGQAAQIAAAAKAQFPGDPEAARKAYKEQIMILQQQRSPGGVPIG